MLIAKAGMEELIEVMLENEPFIIKGHHFFLQV